MTPAEHYSAGRAEGARWAEHDAQFDRALITETLLEAREEVSNAIRRGERAYWLGILRGYREGVRT